jgi:predicted amidohydrolase YtcJ
VGSIPGDRIGHGALIPAESIAEIRRHGLTVVTQPGFLSDRGDDYLRHVEAIDLPDLYRVQSLIDAGVAVAFSSNAPYGPVDTWPVVDSAVHRRSRDGFVIGEHEIHSRTSVLRCFLGPQTLQQWRLGA